MSEGSGKDDERSSCPDQRSNEFDPLGSAATGGPNVARPPTGTRTAFAVPTVAGLTPAEAAEYLDTTAKALERLRGRHTGPEYARAENGRVTYTVTDLDAWRDSAEDRKREAGKAISEGRRGISPSPEALERMRQGQQVRQARTAPGREANRERVEAERQAEVKARRYRGRRSGVIPTYAAVHGRLRVLHGQARNYLCISCREPAAQWAYGGGCEHELIEDGMPHYRPLCVQCHTAERGSTIDRPSPELAAIRAAYAHCEALPDHPLIAAP